MVRITFESLKLHKAVLEIRYVKGYRYWDVCGKCILEINTKTNDEFDFQQLQGGEECILKLKNNPCRQASFGFRRMTVSGTHLKNINLFKEQAPLIFEVVRENLDIKHLDRIGFRFWYVYGTDTFAEADQIVNDLGLFQVAAERFVGFGDKVEKLVPSLVVADGKTKVAIHIGSAKDQNLSTQTRSPEEEEYSPQNCVLVDIDFFRENINAQDIKIEDFIHYCHKTLKENVKIILNPQGAK